MSPYKYIQFYLGDILEFIEYMNENKKFAKSFHIGTQKAGSTYLYNLLTSHGEQR
jgi:hypothetical protein